MAVLSVVWRTMRGQRISSDGRCGRKLIGAHAGRWVFPARGNFSDRPHDEQAIVSAGMGQRRLRRNQSGIGDQIQVQGPRRIDAGAVTAKVPFYPVQPRKQVRWTQAGFNDGDAIQIRWTGRVGPGR